MGPRRLRGAGAPVAVEGAVGVADEGADGRERREDLEADELEHLVRVKGEGEGGGER